MTPDSPSSHDARRLRDSSIRPRGSCVLDGLVAFDRLGIPRSAPPLDPSQLRETSKNEMRKKKNGEKGGLHAVIFSLAYTYAN